MASAAKFETRWAATDPASPPTNPRPVGEGIPVGKPSPTKRAAKTEAERLNAKAESGEMYFVRKYRKPESMHGFGTE